MYIQTLRGLLGWTVVAATLRLSAGTLTVAVAPQEIAGPVRIEIRSMSDGGIEQIEVVANVPRMIELANGTYSVSLAESRPLWAMPRVVYIGVPGSSVLLEVEETVAVTGRFRPPSRTKTPPDAATARVVLDDDGTAEIPCVLEKWQWRCSVPKRTLHFSIKPLGYVATYWWDLKLAADRDLGEVALRTGASFVGYVALPRDRRKAMEQVTVRLSRRGAARSEGRSTEVKADAAALRTRPNANGFFHFDAVPPGEYIVRALLPGLTSLAQSVRILENLEAALRAPLQLEPPHTLQIAVVPARDASDLPWSVELTRETETEHVFEPVRQMRLSNSGRVSVTNLPAGRYDITVRDAAYNGLARQSFLVPDDGNVLELEVNAIRVSGDVLLGSEPLQARVWLGGEHGVPSVAVESRSDGRFDAVLPAAFTNVIPEVTVRADLPAVNTTISDVRVIADDNGAKRVRIALPETGLSGRVVDESGSPVARALVNVTAANNQLIQATVHEDGTFDLFGLPAGPAILSAADRGRKSNSVHVDVALDPAVAEPVVLVLRQAPLFRGRVVSSTGPVPGAAVYLFPVGLRGFAARRLGTDVRGDFQETVPAGATAIDVFVSAPGFGLTLQRHRLSEDIVEIPVTEAAGEITLEFERSESDVAANYWPTIAHGGATRDVLTLAAINARAVQETAGKTSKIRLPDLEPGDYTFCAGQLCRPVTLAPYRNVSVALR